MKRLLIFGCVVALPVGELQAAGTSPPTDFLHDFKGVKLEVSLGEFRSMPHPDGLSASVVCTGQKVGNSVFRSEPFAVMIYDDVEKKLGVKKCVWVTHGEKYLNGRTSGLSIAASGYAAYDYSFSFIPDPKDGVLRLYKFSATTNVSAFSHALDALTAKFGKPKIIEGKVQNKMGASFENTTALWESTVSSIMIQSRWTKIDNMGILMLDERLNAAVRAAREAKKAAMPNAI